MDSHLSTRISLFSPRNNRLVLARSTRKFRRKMESSRQERRSGDGLTRREGSFQHFFFAFMSAEKKGSIECREIKTRMIESGQRSKDEDRDARGRQCKGQDEVEGFPEAIHLNTLGIIVEGKRKREKIRVVPKWC